jgi:hypothetical protein
MVGQDFLVTFEALSKVTRRKGETISRRYRSDGYVHHQKTSRPTQSHREQAPSYRGSGTPAKSVSTGKPPSRGKPAHRIVYIRNILVGCQAAIASKG